jgi:site-specific recombinase XerD
MQHNLQGGFIVITLFREWLEENGKSDNTVQSYVLNINQYLKWYRETFGIEMTGLLHGNILDYRSYLQNIKKQKAVTVNAKLAALISFNSFLNETGRQTNSAATKKDLLKTQAAYASPSDIAETDVDSLRQTILLRSGLRDHAVVTILAYAGLRISEALSLTVADVDCVGREITVNHGKGNKERIVYIGDKVIHAVKEYLKARNSDSPWLFPGRYGNRLHRSVMNKVFNQYSSIMTPHTMRHFFCTNALEKDYSIHEVANQAGHSNLHTTIRYTRPSRTAMKDKANRL